MGASSKNSSKAGKKKAGPDLEKQLEEVRSALEKEKRALQASNKELVKTRGELAVVRRRMEELELVETEIEPALTLRDENEQLRKKLEAGVPRLPNKNELEKQHHALREENERLRLEKDSLEREPPADTDLRKNAVDTLPRATPFPAETTSIFRLSVYPCNTNYNVAIEHLLSGHKKTFTGLDGAAVSEFMKTHLPQDLDKPIPTLEIVSEPAPQLEQAAMVERIDALEIQPKPTAPPGHAAKVGAEPQALDSDRRPIKLDLERRAANQDLEIPLLPRRPALQEIELMQFGSRLEAEQSLRAHRPFSLSTSLRLSVLPTRENTDIDTSVYQVRVAAADSEKREVLHRRGIAAELIPGIDLYSNQIDMPPLPPGSYWLRIFAVAPYAGIDESRDIPIRMM